VDFFQAVSSAEQLPVFASKRIVVVKGRNLLGDQLETGEEILTNYLTDNNPDTCFIMITDKIDARKKIIKLIKEKGEVLNISSPKGGQLISWIDRQAKRRGKSIEKKAIDLLITAIGDNLLLLEQEVEKVCLYCQKETILMADLEKTLSLTATLNIFRITDLVAEKKAGEAIALFKEMTVVGEHPTKVMALISKSFRQLLRAKLLVSKRGHGPDELAKELKLHSFVGKKLFNQQRFFSLEHLEQAVKTLKNYDWLVKTGQYDAVIAVEMAIHFLVKQKEPV
ncbi:MAG: DNA polymerase III subunit delta, partial [Bacillota bacterium]|nr:DNA polymerase III subunit delta [Bacillota bacterium]